MDRLTAGQWTSTTWHHLCMLLKLFAHSGKICIFSSRARSEVPSVVLPVLSSPHPGALGSELGEAPPDLWDVSAVE